MKFNITIEMVDVTREDLMHLNSVLGPLNGVTTTTPAPKEEAPTPTPKEEVPAHDPKEEAPAPDAKKKSPKEKVSAPVKEESPKEEAPKEEAPVKEEASVKEEDLLDVAVKRATALLADGDTTPVKNALKAAGARRVSELRGDALVTFLDALPEED